MALQDIANRLPTTNQIAALAGTSGAPGSGNKFVTDSDPRLSGVGGGGSGGGADRYCLQFVPGQSWGDGAGTSDHHVYHGIFLNPSQTLGACWWEAIINASDVNPGYVIVINFGGSHPILLGTTGGNGRVGISGNFHTSGANQSFGSAFTGQSIDTFPINTWHHIAVGWDGSARAFVYLDGILTDIAPVVAREAGTTPGDLGLWIGASREHNGFSGKVLRVRGFEGNTPFSGNTFPQAFTPQLTFPGTVFVGTSAVKAAFCADYSKVADTIIDYSAGFNGRKHDGYRAMYELQNVTASKLPQWVLANFAEPAFSGTPETPTAGALLFDDFAQPDETFLWRSGENTANTAHIRQSRSGNNVTARTWHGDVGALATVGVLQGAACPLAQDAWNNPNLSVALANVTTNNHSVTVTQRGGAGVYVYVRWTNSGNWIRVYAKGAECSVTRYTNGSPNSPQQPPAISNTLWTDLTATANGGNITITCGGMTHTFADTMTGTEVGFGLSACQRAERIVAMPPA